MRHLARQHGDSRTELSHSLGRNRSYLQQFIGRGSPKRLEEDDRLWLAQRWQVDERLLGARDPWTPAR